MSELQIGLLALGALVVVCVLAFNKFQELRARRQANQHFASGHEDVLLRGGAKEEGGAAAKGGETLPPRTWVEPTWNQQLEDIPDPSGAAADALPGVDPLRANTQPGAQAGHASEPVVVHGPPVLDDRIDFIAELQFVEPLLGSHLVMEIEKFAAGRIIGCDGFNAAAGDWEALDRDAVYEMARIGIQLSDRGGPLRAEELEQFQQWVDQTAARLGAMVEWTGMQSPLTRAAELDAFCAEVDVQISVNLVSTGPIAETKLRGLSEAHGFRKEADGVYRRRDDEGLELISLRQSAPTAVTLTYDVPRVPRDAAAFGMLMHCGRTIGKGLDAKIVDDNGRPLDEAMQSRIQSSLAGIHARMEAADMPAGGALAQRIFT
jgi:hypothetical protein